MSPRTSAPFGRVLTAMVTPFTDSGAVDLAAAVALASHLVDHGHDGLVVSGTTGESPTTDPGEQRELLQAVIGAVGDRASVVAGAGTNDTAHSVKLAESAIEVGADGLLVVTPYYSKPSQEGVLAHFRAIADVSSKPVMVYDIPGRSVLKLTPETLARAAEHPRIVAVKEASGDLYAGSWLLRRTDLVIYSGDDALNLAWLAVGAVGVVSVIGHVVGDRLADMIAAVDAGDLESARKIDQALLPVTEAIKARGPGAVMAKAALQLLGLLPSRMTRSPYLPATDDEVAQLRADLANAHLLEDLGA
jgi:4-hydroxy-tetrahydrodipicolinate synthase